MTCLLCPAWRHNIFSALTLFWVRIKPFSILCVLNDLRFFCIVFWIEKVRCLAALRWRMVTYMVKKTGSCNFFLFSPYVSVCKVLSFWLWYLGCLVSKCKSCVSLIVILGYLVSKCNKCIFFFTRINILYKFWGLWKFFGHFCFS